MVSSALYQQFGSPGQQFALGGQAPAGQALAQQPNLQHIQQVLGQLEQAEARHAQMLQQIHAEEQFAVQQLQQIRAQVLQFAPFTQGAQLQQQPISTFPRI